MDTPTWESTAPVEQAPPAADMPQHEASIGGVAANSPQEEAPPTWDNTVDPEQYDTIGSHAKAAASGALEGAVGPLGPLIEKEIFHRKPEDLRIERAQHPITRGVGQAVGLGASLFTGVGEGALLAKAGSAASKAAGLGEAASIGAKIGSAALDQGVQMALLSGSDDVSRMIINDPDVTAQSAIANMGMNAALGGLTGAAIGSISPLWKASGIGSKTAKFAQEFKDEMKFLHENPNPIAAATQELNDLHLNTQSLKESLRQTGVKGDLVKEFLPEITEQNTAKINEQLQQVSNNLSDTVTSMKNNMKASAQAKNLEQDLIDFQSKVQAEGATYLDKRNALNDLRGELHNYTKWDRMGTTEGTELSKYARQINKDLVPMLEDQKVWGRAGKVQQEFNSGFHDFTNSKAEKDFLKTFTTEVAGERVLSPAKIDTFVRQAGSAKAEIKNDILQNYIREHSKFADKLNTAVGALGKDPVVPSPSLGMLNKIMGEKTAGAELAQKLVKSIGDNVLGRTAAAGVGGAAGSMFGHPGIGAIIGEHALGGTFKSVMAGLTKAITESPVAAAGFKSALDFAIAAAKGQKTLGAGITNVFKPGAQVLATHLMPDSKGRDKLDKTVTNLQDNPDKFTKIDNGQVGHYMPNHQQSLTQSSAQALQYLQSIKPQPHILGPLDKPVPPQPSEISRYNRALDIAQQPAIVLDHIKDGTIQPSDIADLHNMYPALYKDMSQKLSNEMTMQHSAGISIPYRTKIGISLFLGQPVESSMNPANILAAQPQHQQKPQQQAQQQGKTRKGTTSLGKSVNSYRTNTQAAEAKRND